MRAVVYRAWGPPESLELVDGLAEPQAKAEQVTIAVKAAGVNPGDAATLSGKFRWMVPKGFPKILGLEVAGEVVAAPPGAGFSLGERVFAATDILLAGGYAELQWRMLLILRIYHLSTAEPLVLRCGPVPNNLSSCKPSGRPANSALV